MVSKKDEEEYKKVLAEYEKNQKLIRGPIEDVLEFEKEKKQEYYQKNKEEIKEKQREYYQKNKEEIKYKRRHYYQKNKEAKK